MKKVVAVIGGSASGIYFSLLLKEKHPEYDVILIEKENKIGKKIYATGNGHCNCLNTKLSKESFNDSKLVDIVLNKYSYTDLKDFFLKRGILLKETEDGLVYPLSNSASSFVSLLEAELEKEGVRVLIKTRLLDYNDTEIIVEKEGVRSFIKYDYLIIGAGGKSGKNLGSDGSVFDILKKHKYQITDLKPGLCPIKTKEVFKDIEGSRLKGRLEARDSNDVLLFREDGELLFKKDGISGIVAFNLSRVLARTLGQIKIRFIPEPFLNDSFKNELSCIYNLKAESVLSSIYDPKISAYLSKKIAKLGLNFGNKDNFNRVFDEISLFSLTYNCLYSFEESQITIGGISSDFVGSKFNSKIEKNVYFIGEILDVDGKCGGFNLSWALLSAMLVSDNF